jgi:hypothetical protein
MISAYGAGHEGLLRNDKAAVVTRARAHYRNEQALAPGGTP